MRVLYTLLFASLAVAAAGARATCLQLYEFTPTPALTLDVDWPQQPTLGFDWRYGIPLTASADDSDVADIFEWNEVTQEYEFWGQMEVWGSPEIVWTCSWGIFSETGTNQAIGASAHWMPTEPLQDTVTIECEANDRHDELGLCDDGDRDDQDDYDFAVYDVRFPKTITVASRRRVAGDPPLDEGYVFGYYNTVEVLDNWGGGFAGLEVRQDLADPFKPPERPRNTHGDSTSEAGNTWIGPDATGTTDQDGRINSLDLVQGPLSEGMLEEDSPHVLKRVFVVDRPVVRRMYFNPLPLCTGQHLNSYPSLPPP